MDFMVFQDFSCYISQWYVDSPDPAMKHTSVQVWTLINVTGRGTVLLMLHDDVVTTVLDVEVSLLSRLDVYNVRSTSPDFGIPWCGYPWMGRVGLAHELRLHGFGDHSKPH